MVSFHCNKILATIEFLIDMAQHLYATSNGTLRQHLCPYCDPGLVGDAKDL